MRASDHIHHMKLRLAKLIVERLSELTLSQSDIARSTTFKISRSGLNDILNGRVDGHSLHKIVSLAHCLGLSCEMSVMDSKTGKLVY